VVKLKAVHSKILALLQVGFVSRFVCLQMCQNVRWAVEVKNVKMIVELSAGRVAYIKAGCWQMFFKQFSIHIRKGSKIFIKIFKTLFFGSI
jgi:hypothetical protein